MIPIPPHPTLPPCSQVVLQDFNHFCLIIPEPDGGAPSTLGQPNRTIMLISPYFDYTGQQVASLLAWHMAWHEKVGGWTFNHQ